MVAVDEHAIGPREPFRIMGGRQNISKGGMALFNAAIYLHRTVLAVFRSLNYEIPQGVVDEFSAGLKELTELTTERSCPADEHRVSWHHRAVSADGGSSEDKYHQKDQSHRRDHQYCDALAFCESPLHSSSVTRD